MVRFGIVGIGNMGSSYCKWFLERKIENGLLVAVCDSAEHRRLWAKENLPADVAIFEDSGALIASNLADAVLVATPHYAHPEIAVDALRHGLHVLVDKPAGVYAGQIRRMNDVARAHPRQKFAMMFNQRANPLYQRIKEIVARGEIGGIRKVNWIITTWWRTQKYYDSSPWRATWHGEGGGLLVNQAPHQLDLLQWICGMTSLARGYLKYGSHRDIAVEDDVTAYFEYPNGATGTFISCTHDAVGSDRLDIQGDRGKIVVENSCTAKVMRLYKSEEEYNRELDFRQMLALVKGEGGERLYETETFFYPERWDVQHIDLLANFVQAVENDAPLIAHGAEGIRAVEIANAIYLSDWLGREVAVPVDPELFYEELGKKIEQEGR